MTREDLGNLIADYIVDTSEEFASAIDWRIENDALDYAENRLNQHGWFKEHTCRMDIKPTNDWLVDRAVCSFCGKSTTVSVNRKDMPNYCPWCGARVVE